MRGEALGEGTAKHNKEERRKRAQAVPALHRAPCNNPFTSRRPLSASSSGSSTAFRSRAWRCSTLCWRSNTCWKALLPLKYRKEPLHTGSRDLAQLQTPGQNFRCWPVPSAQVQSCSSGSLCRPSESNGQQLKLGVLWEPLSDTGEGAFTEIRQHSTWDWLAAVVTTEGMLAQSSC